MRRKTRTGSFLGFEAEGPTKREAEATAREMAEALVLDIRDFAPVVMRVALAEALVWRSLTCWTYAILRGGSADEGGVVRQTLYVAGGETRLTMAADAIAHVAAMAWTHEVEDDDAFFRQAIAQNAIPGLAGAMADELLAKCVGQASWQRSYRRLIAGGCTAAEAHGRACSRQRGPEAEALGLAA